jgi:hypothetical protein
VHDSATATEGGGPYGAESFGIGPPYPPPFAGKRALTHQWWASWRLTDRPVSQAGNVTG